MANRNRAWAALWDFSFTEFITIRLARLIFGSAIAVAGLVGVAIVISGFRQSLLLGIVGLVIGCTVFLVAVVMTRVWLEGTVLFFRMAEHVAELVEHEAEIALNTATDRHVE